MPDAGEKESEDGKRFPSDLANSSAIKKTPDGFTYIDPAQFHELFAADVPADQAAFMAASQVFNFADNFSATITTAAWRTKPSWMLVAGSDRIINPELERWYAARAKATKSKSRAQVTRSTFPIRSRRLDRGSGTKRSTSEVGAQCHILRGNHKQTQRITRGKSLAFIKLRQIDA